MDAILKIYNRGNLKGKFAIFFKSDKAKNICERIGVKPVTEDNETSYIIAGENTGINLKKAELFLNRHQLHYEEIHLN